MTWYHLEDQNGNHYIIPGSLSPVIYFLSQAVDGSEPIYMYLNGGLTFTITPALFTTIVGAVPAAIQVQRLAWYVVLAPDMVGRIRYRGSG